MNDWTLLIDFGTSFTRAAIADDEGRTELIKLDGLPAMPSGIWADAGGKLVAGAAADQQSRGAPERWDRSPGLSLGGPDRLRLGQFDIDPVAAVAEVLRRVTAEAVAQRGSNPHEIRLTHPARWGLDRRDALLTAARRAGLSAPPPSTGPQLVEYPVAAALHLARLGRFPVGATLALFGLGGGSVETAVIESTEAGVVLRALGGIEGIGGEHFDDLLYRQLIARTVTPADAQLAQKLWEPPDAAWRQAGEDLFRQVRRAKEELSEQRQVPLDPGPLVEMPLQLSRIELESALRPLILRSARELGTTIELAKLRARQLDGILLIGEGSRIPLVARAVFDVTGVHPELMPDPDFFLGAAIWKPEIRVGSGDTPITVSGRQSRDEAAEAAAEAAAATAATGAIDLSVLTTPRRRPGPVPPEPQRAKSADWYRRWPLVAALIAVLVVVGVVLITSASGNDVDDGLARPPSSAASSASSADGLPAVQGLSVSTREISIDLSWQEVPGAEGYAVYRNPGMPNQTIQTVTRTSYTDRPGDDAEHVYSVVALDGEEIEGQPGEEVRAQASAPYGEVQAIASNWTAVVPVAPGTEGSAGQTCTGSAKASEHAESRITCRFANGVRVVITSYEDADSRDRRAAELAERAGVKESDWSEALPEGERFRGQMLSSPTKADGGPWRWWTYDRLPEYAIQAFWPDRTAKELTDWWQQKAPFRF